MEQLRYDMQLIDVKSSTKEVQCMEDKTDIVFKFLCMPIVKSNEKKLLELRRTTKLKHLKVIRAILILICQMLQLSSINYCTV